METAVTAINNISNINGVATSYANMFGFGINNTKALGDISAIELANTAGTKLKTSVKVIKDHFSGEVKRTNSTFFGCGNMLEAKLPIRASFVCKDADGNGVVALPPHNTSMYETRAHGAPLLTSTHVNKCLTAAEVAGILGIGEENANAITGLYLQMDKGFNYGESVFTDHKAKGGGVYVDRKIPTAAGSMRRDKMSKEAVAEFDKANQLRCMSVSVDPMGKVLPIIIGGKLAGVDDNVGDMPPVKDMIIDPKIASKVQLSDLSRLQFTLKPNGGLTTQVVPEFSPESGYRTVTIVFVSGEYKRSLLEAAYKAMTLHPMVYDDFVAHPARYSHRYNYAIVNDYVSGDMRLINDDDDVLNNFPLFVHMALQLWNNDRGFYSINDIGTKAFHKYVSDSIDGLLAGKENAEERKAVLKAIPDVVEAPTIYVREKLAVVQNTQLQEQLLTKFPPRTSKQKANVPEDNSVDLIDVEAELLKYGEEKMALVKLQKYNVPEDNSVHLIDIA